MVESSTAPGSIAEDTGYVSPKVDTNYTVSLGSDEYANNLAQHNYMLSLERDFTAVAKETGLTAEQANKMASFLTGSSKAWAEKMQTIASEERRAFESSLEYKMDELSGFASNYAKEHGLSESLNLNSKDSIILMQHLKKMAGRPTATPQVSEPAHDLSSALKAMKQAIEKKDHECIKKYSAILQSLMEK